MSGDTSIGTDKIFSNVGDAADRAIVSGVDAQAANDADMQQGLAGAEAKPFGKDSNTELPANAEVDKSPSNLTNHSASAPPPGGQQGADADRAR